ncbi:hypothetical protein PSA01_30330 [Pseudonocardia saturnea]|uniref:Uncharacterized protein n=1 Tax=Pseudonocardia saturnea TaxID=33909 RepID=A0ABQ0S077_9PSEU|nr:hypothetical protein Pdca_24860 [Pseudonocardia autotrophica]GEC26004.1 hypothetical protein PSA01_30330 [Pseudonocardia saturnea]
MSVLVSDTSPSFRSVRGAARRHDPRVAAAPDGGNGHHPGRGRTVLRTLGRPGVPPVAGGAVHDGRSVGDARLQVAGNRG